MDSNKSSSSSVGIATVLFLIFLVLKLCGVISWSWWWVTAPLWISFGLWLLIVVPVLIYIKLERRKLKKTMSSTFRRWNWRD